MQLCDRGANYELNPAFISIKDSEIISKYRGLPVRMTALYQETVPQLIMRLTCRGNNYIGLY